MIPETSSREPIALKVKSVDNRYPVEVEIDGVETFKIFFNPGDPFTIRCADALSKIEFPTGNDSAAFVEFADNIEKNLDIIFGAGSAMMIFRYESAEFALIKAILDKVRQGQAHFKEHAEAAERAAKMQAVIDAKKEGSSYIANL